MPVWLVILVCAGALAVVTIITISVRRRAGRPPRNAAYLLGEDSSARHRSATRQGPDSVALGERIELWTQQPTPHDRPLSPQTADAGEGQLVGAPVSTAVALPARESGEVTSRHLMAPVELWFGAARVGVVSGSPTHLEFSRYAAALLAELPKRA